jgi:hypothetical protein
MDSNSTNTQTLAFVAYLAGPPGFSEEVVSKAIQHAQEFGHCSLSVAPTHCTLAQAVGFWVRIKSVFEKRMVPITYKPLVLRGGQGWTQTVTIPRD